MRVTIAHLEVMHPDDAKRFKKLGVYADISAHWIGNGAPGTLAFLGQKKGDVIAFRGIPFVGKQPVGEHRWYDLTPGYILDIVAAREQNS